MKSLVKKYNFIKANVLRSTIQMLIGLKNKAHEWKLQKENNCEK